MQIEFWTSKERVGHILNTIEGSKVIETDKKLVRVSLEIKTGYDALQLFHAGINSGMETMENTVKNH